MKKSLELPTGFLAAGRNVGIKNSKYDMGLLVCDGPAVMAASLTPNLCRAHCVERTSRLRSAAKKVRAIVVVSGNANALTGPQGARDDEALAAALGHRLSVEADEVITASTGVIGYRLPLNKVLSGIGGLVDGLSTKPDGFAKGIMTTDRVTKIAAKELFIAGKRVRLHGIAKGAGMIAPSMATMLCFLTTDAAITRASLQEALSDAVDATLNQLTIDNDMSTNDTVVALANGRAQNDEITKGTPEYAIFARGLGELLEELAEAIARDGEGATRLLKVVVEGAASSEDARGFARAVAGSMLVKAAVFGADPNAGGRMLSAVGARAASTEAAFDAKLATLKLQGETVFVAGALHVPDEKALRRRMLEPDVFVHLDVGQGQGRAVAWGCDLSYDYVKINADYAAVTVASEDGSVAVNEQLAEFGPSLKKKLVIEALRYIDQFRGMRAVIKLGGAAMVDPKLEDEFAEDVLLLRSVGLLPIVVHGGGPEISSTLERLNLKTEFVNGLRVTDSASMSVVEMVLTGSVNQRIVAALNRRGSRAVGLSGKDGALIRARKCIAERDLGRVGEVESVDGTLLEILERDGRIPVVSPVGLGEEGRAYNINADTVAAELARCVGARKLIFLSDVPGLLDDGRLVSQLTSDQLRSLLDRGVVKGGMRPKLEASLRALAGGVQSVHLVDGRVPHNVVAELFTDQGVGTLIRRA